MPYVRLSNPLTDPKTRVVRPIGDVVELDEVPARQLVTAGLAVYTDQPDNTTDTGQTTPPDSSTDNTQTPPQSGTGAKKGVK